MQARIRNSPAKNFVMIWSVLLVCVISFHPLSEVWVCPDEGADAFDVFVFVAELRLSLFDMVWT